jgi:glycosyltransferase involved in cell wall biosynthesis
LIVINKNNFKDFEKTYPFLKDRIRLVYNGIDIQRFSICSAERLRTELNIKTENVLLFTGRIDKEKGIHILIEIFPIIAETHPDVVLLITGDGAMKNILMEKVAMDKLSDKILFLGKVPYQRLPEYYSLSKIFVFPTLRFEGLPYNVIEALSCGCVVIASKRGGMESIIESGKNGILIDPKNKNMLVGEICKILDEPDLQREIRRNAREFAEKYLSIETMIDSTEKIFFEAIESYRSSK